MLSVSAGYRIVEGQDFRVVLLYEMAGHLALAAAAIALGELVRARRRIAELTDEQIALAAEHRLDQHKQALSRELHDTIGHTLTVAAIHANVACQEARRDPDAAATALGEVTASVSASLTALRTAVRELRTEAPTRSDVEMVAEQARAAGYTVRTRLDPAAPATAYRVAREGLVNALRHAAGRSIDVEVRRCERNVLVRVRDGGTGLATLRAEVAGLGGRFDAGPAGDGWQVTATVPAGERGRRG